MLMQAKQLNPECAFVQGDMRTRRLGRAFDAVLLDDAISHLFGSTAVCGSRRNTGRWVFFPWTYGGRFYAKQVLKCTRGAIIRARMNTRYSPASRRMQEEHNASALRWLIIAESFDFAGLRQERSGEDLRALAMEQKDRGEQDWREMTGFVILCSRILRLNGNV